MTDIGMCLFGAGVITSSIAISCLFISARSDRTKANVMLLFLLMAILAMLCFFGSSLAFVWHTYGNHNGMETSQHPESVPDLRGNGQLQGGRLPGLVR